MHDRDNRLISISVLLHGTAQVRMFRVVEHMCTRSIRIEEVEIKPSGYAVSTSALLTDSSRLIQQFDCGFKRYGHLPC